MEAEQEAEQERLVRRAVGGAARVSPPPAGTQHSALQVGGQLLPLPVCRGHGGRRSGLHALFHALASPACKLNTLILDRCILDKQVISTHIHTYD